MELIYIALIIVIIIISLWFVFGSSKSRCLSELNGMWIADNEFCEESGIELMTIYFGDCPKTLIDDEDQQGTNKLCWILIINDKGEYNHITVANIRGGKNIKDKQYEFDLNLRDSPDNIFATDLTISIVPGELITIIDSDTKIFEGLKNKEASDAIEFNISDD